MLGRSLATYRHRSIDHGRMLHFSFCRTCGNRIGLALERFPTVQILYGGTFDDPRVAYSKLAHFCFQRSALDFSSCRGCAMLHAAHVQR